MSKEEKKEILYRYLTYFLVFSFFGWIFETLVVYFFWGQLTERGYFFVGPHFGNVFVGLDSSKLSWMHFIWGLPAIEMYGIGGVLIIFLLKRYKDKILPLFFLGALYMTVFELLGSYWCEIFLGRRYWEYSHEFLNFEGRICLQSTVAWAVLSVFVVQFIEPALDKFYKYIQRYRFTNKIIVVLTVYMIICALVKYVFITDIIPN